MTFITQKGDIPTSLVRFVQKGTKCRPGWQDPRPRVEELKAEGPFHEVCSYIIIVQIGTRIHFIFRAEEIPGLLP